MPVDTTPVRKFLATVATDFVEIAKDDLLKLLDAADRPPEPRPRVPPVAGMRAVQATA